MAVPRIVSPLAETGRGRAAPQTRGLWQEMRRSWQAYALLSPIFILLVVFMYYPPILGFVRAFYQWAPGREPVFVGVRNFTAYFSYPETPRELANMLKLLYFGLITGVIVPFIMAEMVFTVRDMRIKSLYRLFVVIPMLAPGVVTILLWKHIYDPEYGPINVILNGLGMHVLARNWLGDPATALYAIIFVGFPWMSGVGTLIYLGGLGQIGESVYDSCLLDNCTGLRRVLLIDLPLVLGQVRLQTILSVVGAVTVFNSVLVLTNGGPGFATMVPGLTMYKRAFVYQEFGYASAVGLMLFVVAMVCTLLTNRFVKPYDEDLGR